jgi:4-hydroxy-2-oxoheptanedioate aldolase
VESERNLFKEGILERRVQIGLWNSLCSPVAADVISGVGYDWVLVDMEHSPNDIMSVLWHLQIYRGSGTTAVVRPPWNDPVTVKRLLDIGVFSLLFPMIQTAEEAEAAVRACRYPPHGIRGVSLSQRANRYGGFTDYLVRVDDINCVLVQIETRAALERVEEIAAVEGVDGVFFGPADLSADLGYLGQPAHPDVLEIIHDGVRRVTAVGKPSGILAPDAARSRQWLERGVCFVACGSDLNLLARGARQLLADVRA